MPRKKMTNRKAQTPTKSKTHSKTKSKTTSKSMSFSPKTLNKVEKEFFTIPTKLVKNANKQLTVLQKKNSKLTKAVAKVSTLASKLEKKLLDIKQSKKVVKRAVASALKKQHQATLKQQAALSKEHQQIVATLSPLEGFHAKFNFLSKQLVQLDKEWSTIQKGNVDAKNSKKSKISSDKKKTTVNKQVESWDEGVSIPNHDQESVSMEEEELSTSTESNS